VGQEGISNGSLFLFLGEEWIVYIHHGQVVVKAFSKFQKPNSKNQIPKTKFQNFFNLISLTFYVAEHILLVLSE